MIIPHKFCAIMETHFGSASLYTNIISPKVEKYAQHFYSILKNRNLISAAIPKSSVAALLEEQPDWEEVNLKSIKDEECRVFILKVKKQTVRWHSMVAAKKSAMMPSSSH